MLVKGSCAGLEICRAARSCTNMKGPSARQRTRMHRPIEELRAEHALVNRGIETLSAIGEHVGAHADFPAADVAVLLRFLREFVVAVHMRKEAEVVWPAIALRGDEATAAAIGELFRLHADVTDLTHSLVLFWEPIDDLSAEEREGFAGTVSAFVAQLRRMQRIEEGAVFAACDDVPPDDQLDWADRFREMERGRPDRASWAKRLAPIARNWLS